MAEAKITVSADDLASAVLESVNKKLRDTGNAAEESSKKLSPFQKYIDDLTPSTKNAGSAFNDLHGTISEMWESPTSAVKDLAGAVGTDLTAGLGAAGVAAGIAAAAFAAAGAAAFELSEKSAAIGANINDMGEKMGESAVKVSNLRGAAQIAGGSLEQISNAVFKFQQQMGEGSEKVTTGLERIGLSVEDLKQQDPSDQFLSVATAIRQIEDPTQRAAAAFEIFGKQGRDLLPLMMKPLDELVEKSRALGSTWTDEDAKAAEEFEMQMNALKLQIENVFVGIGRDLIPAVSTAIDWFVKAASFTVEWGGKLSGLSFVFGTVKDAAHFVIDAYDVMTGKAVELPKVTGDATRALKNEQEAMNDLRVTVPTLDQALATDKEAHRALDDQIKQSIADHKKAQDAIEKFRNSVEALDFKRYVRDGLPYVGLIRDISEQAGSFRDELDNLDSSINEFHHGLSVAGDDLTTVIIPSFSTLAHGLVPQFRDAIKEAHDAIDNEGGGFLSGLMGKVTGALDPKTILNSMIGGGLSGLVSTGIGLVGKGLSALLHLGGPSQQELQGRDVEGQFEKTMGGMQGIQKALLDAGLTADQANAKLQSLWASEKSGGDAVQKQIDGINQVLKDHQAQVEADAKAVTDAFGGVTTAAQAYAGPIPADIQQTIDKLLTMNGLTDDQKTKLSALTQQAEPDFQKLTGIASQYGLTIGDLGPKFQQANIDSTANKIFDDFKQLTDAGADADAILGKMGKSVQSVVTDALTFGVAIPKNMQPVLQKMADLGQLTDGQGKKLGDLSGISFDDAKSPLQQSLDGLKESLDHLSDTLLKLPGNAQSAAAGIASSLGSVQVPEIHVPYVYDRRGDDMNFAAAGGFVTTRGVEYFGQGGWAPRGTDTVRAMLTPGELVLNQPQQNLIGRLLATGGTVGTKLEAQMRDLSDRLDRHMANYNATLTTLPAMLRSALRNV